MITVTRNRDVWYVKVSGNASFEFAPALRELNGNLKNEPYAGVWFDMGECTWMDSTFMGMVARIALETRKQGIKPEIYKASEKVQKLLNNLGLTKLVVYKEGAPVTDLSMKTADTAPAKAVTQLENAQNVIDAHKTLMEIDEANVERFTPVVELVQHDLDKLEQEKNSNS